MDEMEQLYQRHAERGPRIGLRVGLFVFGTWTALMLLWSAQEAHAYRECVANDGFLCMDFSGAILALWAVVSAVGWGIAGVVIAVRAYLRRRD